MAIDCGNGITVRLTGTMGRARVADAKGGTLIPPARELLLTAANRRQPDLWRPPRHGARRRPAVARAVIEGQRGQHPEQVFPYSEEALHRMNDSAWCKARKRAALKWEQIYAEAATRVIEKSRKSRANEKGG